MKNVYSLLWMLLMAAAASAQNFPADFVGYWKGEMVEVEQGGKVEKLPVQVLIQPTDTLGQYSWLMYSIKRDSISFILRPIDSAQGQWGLSLRGMLFHQYWLDGKLYGMYTIDPQTVHTTYWLDEGKLMMEFSSNDSRPFSTTGKGTSNSPFVETYRLQSVVKATLSKQRENDSR